MNLIEFQQKFSDEKACKDWLIEKKWGKNKIVKCPHCGSIHISTHKTRDIYTCLECKKQFTLRIGTIFEDSRIPLYKWFISIYLFTSLKKGISSIQLAKYISVTQKTAWFILHRIREVMNNENNQLNGIVEIDETYIGGKAENMHSIKRTEAKGVYEKSAVFGMLERQGKVKAKYVNDTKTNTLLKEIYTNIKEDSLLITDEAKQYQSIGHSYIHRTVNHSATEYVRDLKGLKLYTNSIEGFWSQMKKGVNGIYHWVSKKHLQKYVNEFCFRYNEKNVDDFSKFSDWFNNINGAKLVYNNLIK